ncbi:MAG: phosphohydrolase [Cetobacterium sp.]
MQLKNEKAIKFIEELLDHETVKDLENYEDQGVKVSTHTYDVLKISFEEVKRDYGTFEDGAKRYEYFSIIAGIIMHDLSKGTIRKMADNLSHSQMMLKKPDHIAKETEMILKEIEEKLGVEIEETIRKNIIHIVVSHHGKWGKIQPSSREAHLIHRADMYSAKHHRINPIGADKVLNLMSRGMNLEDISELLGCTSGIVKDRLKRAKQELNIKTTKQLMGYYKKNKKIPIGDAFFTRRVKETEKLIRSVDKQGFKNLVLENPFIPILKDADIFKGL